MKKSAIFFFLSLIISLPLIASNKQVVKETQTGTSIEVEVVQEGNISLFTNESQVIPTTIPEDPLVSYTQTYTTYYIAKGENDLLEIHCANYKEVLKTQMSDNQELSAKVGKRGFKFKELGSIIESYNKN